MKKPVKLYYSISEVAEITNLQPYTLRSWEKEFSCLRPRRVHGKNRSYRERDIGIVLRIKRLLYDERYTIQGASRKLKSEPELLRNLEAETAFLHELPPAQEAGGSSEQGVEPAPMGAPENGDGAADSDPAASVPEGFRAAAAEAIADQTTAPADPAPATARERQLRELLDRTRRELRELLQILQ